MRATDREFVVDRLRGYALLGIILVNEPFLLTSSSGFTDISAPNLVWHDGTGLAQAGLFLNYIFAPILSAGIVAAIVLLPRRGLTRAVEADGRMSLTIYLAESILMTTLSNGFGLGFYGLNALAATTLAVIVWVVLLGAAHLWLHRFAIGPAESILRAITYRLRPRLPRLAPPPVETETA